jgi:predicted PurR-regulated permease PerM
MTNSSRAVVLAFVIAVCLYVAYILRYSLMLIYVSVVFAVVLTPAVEAVMRLRIGRWSPGRGAAVMIIIAGAVLALIGFFAIALPPIISDFEALAADLPNKVAAWRQWVQGLPFGAGAQLKFENFEKYIGGLIGGASGIIASTFGVLSTLITALLLTAYLILDGERVFRWLMELLSDATRERLEPALVRAAGGMRKWLIGQGMLMLILGTSSAIVFGILRVRYFYVLAVLTGIGNIVPILGPITTVGIAALVAAVDSWGKLLGVLIFYLAYQQVENAYLTPRIMQAQLEMSTIAILVALIIGGELAGAAGALVAVPTAVLVSALVEEYIVRKHAPSIQGS